MTTINHMDGKIWRLSPWAWGSILGAVTLVCVFSFESLKYMVQLWSSMEEYGYAYIIPVVAFFMIWQKRETLERLRLDGSWAGVILVVDRSRPVASWGPEHASHRCSVRGPCCPGWTSADLHGLARIQRDMGAAASARIHDPAAQLLVSKRLRTISTYFFATRCCNHKALWHQRPAGGECN